MRHAHYIVLCIVLQSRRRRSQLIVSSISCACHISGLFACFLFRVRARCIFIPDSGAVCSYFPFTRLVLFWADEEMSFFLGLYFIEMHEQSTKCRKTVGHSGVLIRLLLARI